MLARPGRVGALVAWARLGGDRREQPSKHPHSEAVLHGDQGKREGTLRGDAQTMEAKPALSSSRSRKPLPSASRLRNTSAIDADSCRGGQQKSAPPSLIRANSNVETSIAEPHTVAAGGRC